MTDWDVPSVLEAMGYDASVVATWRDGEDERYIDLIWAMSDAFNYCTDIDVGDGLPCTRPTTEASKAARAEYLAGEMIGMWKRHAELARRLDEYARAERVATLLLTAMHRRVDADEETADRIRYWGEELGIVRLRIRAVRVPTASIRTRRRLARLIGPCPVIENSNRSVVSSWGEQKPVLVHQIMADMLQSLPFRKPVDERRLRRLREFVE